MNKKTNYKILIEKSLRDVMKNMLLSTASDDFANYTIGINTKYKGLIMPQYLKDKYPSQIILIIQHQFNDLFVEDDFFSIVLSFGGKPEKLTIPFGSILQFVDNSTGIVLDFNYYNDIAKQEQENFNLSSNGDTNLVDFKNLLNKKEK